MSSLTVKEAADTPIYSARFITRQRHASMYWQFLFAWQMMDALVMYLTRPFFAFPINSLMPFLVLIGLGATRISKPILNFKLLILLVIFSLGYMLGALDDATPAYDIFKETVTLACAFIVGYQAIIHQNNLSNFYKILLLVGSAYGIICCLALLGVSKTYLPIIHDTGFDDDGTFINRARVMINENYQIYYLFAPALCFAIKQSYVRAIVAIFALAAGTFTMIKLQTRSGIILLLFAAFACASLRVWYHQRGALRNIAIAGATGLCVLLVKLQTLLNLASGLTHRFTNSSYHTFWGRIESFTYLFTVIFDPYYWYPRGEDVYILTHHDQAHNSLTMAFLNAGLLGFIAWASIIIWPIFSGANKVFKRKITLDQAGIVFGGIISVFASFSLPAAQYEQVWLWAGACNAAILSRRMT